MATVLTPAPSPFSTIVFFTLLFNFSLANFLAASLTNFCFVNFSATSTEAFFVASLANFSFVSFSTNLAANFFVTIRLDTLVAVRTALTPLSKVLLPDAPLPGSPVSSIPSKSFILLIPLKIPIPVVIAAIPVAIAGAAAARTGAAVINAVIAPPIKGKPPNKVASNPFFLLLPLPSLSSSVLPEISRCNFNKDSKLPVIIF